MCFHRLGEIARDNGCFGAIVQCEFNRAYCYTGASMGQCERGYQWRPGGVLLVGQPSANPRVDDVVGKAGFRKVFRLEWSVGRSMVPDEEPHYVRETEFLLEGESPGSVGQAS